MQQQLIQQTIQITPATMTETLQKLTHMLTQQNLNQRVLANTIKSIFYGLWNFDKMINQHYLSTAIAEMMGKIGKKNGFIFFNQMMKFLRQKWNLIDHHRINKFMQLVRYLVRQGLKMSQKKTDEALIQSVFNKLEFKAGLVDHVIQIYFDTACQVNLTKLDTNSPYSDYLPYQKLQIFQKLLQISQSLEQIRLHIVQKIYQKYKQHLLAVCLAKDPQNPEQALQKIQQFNKHILQLAKDQENDVNRKNMYTLIGFMKSDHELFSLYFEEKQQKLRMENQKKKKKITKTKLAVLKNEKNKRKEKNKDKKKPKIISKSKFQFKARQHMQKIMDQ